MPAYKSSVRFPGETARYRTARNGLLAAERDLRRQVERVAKLRRRLPVGGVIKEDYVFDEGAPDPENLKAMRTVRLSGLFRDGFDTLVVYSFMFGPKSHPCPMCTSILDSLDGAAAHLTQRANLAVVAKSPIERIREFARARGWRRLQLLSSSRNSYNADYHGETANGDQMPSLNVFVRRKGQIHHWYHTELLFTPSDRGQDARHVDMIWPLWNVLDMTPEGRGTDWYPQLSYRS